MPNLPQKKPLGVLLLQTFAIVCCIVILCNSLVELIDYFVRDASVLRGKLQEMGVNNGSLNIWAWLSLKKYSLGMLVVFSLSALWQTVRFQLKATSRPPQN